MDTPLFLTMPSPPQLQQQHQQQQQQFSDKAKAGLELMAEEYLAKKRTIVLSEATDAAKNDLMDMLDLPERGAASWSKTYVLPRVDGFSWLNGDENCIENRTGYMAYLNNLLQIPPHYALTDARPNRGLLSVELLRGLPESRKPKDMEKKDHSPQTIGEHFAASYLNPDHAVVTVLTDLNEKWTFFWFAMEEDSSKGALYKLCLDGGEAAADAKHPG